MRSMNPLEFIRSIPSSVKSGWVRTFDFGGTSTRSEFAGFYIGNHLILYFLLRKAFGYAMVGAEKIGFNIDNLGTGVFVAWMIGSAIALFSCVIRRYRDTEKSFWYLAFPVIAITVSAITKTGVAAGIGLFLFIGSLIALALFLTFWPSSKQRLNFEH